jgi:protocatechuate 3,4-dioxygenase beta subunit
MRIPTLILVLACTAAAQKMEAPKAARVEGIVRATTGDPIPRAALSLEGPEDDERPALTASSDEAGRFRFEQVPPGRDYFLTARRPGFGEARYGARSASGPGTPLTMEAGAVINDVVIQMTPQGVITGRVTNPAGDPVVGALVLALQPIYERGERRISLAARASTNDQGEYRIANLAAGTYYVSVADRRLLNAAPGRPPEAYGITYFPNGSDVRDATSLRVMGGNELRGIDVRLHRERVYAVRGKVADASGRPANGTLLAALPVEAAIAGAGAINGPNGGGLQQARAPDASFEFRGLRPGTYLVQTVPGVRMNNAVSPPLIARLDVTIADRDVDGAVLMAGAGAAISGTVKIEGAGLVESLISVGLEEVSSQALNTPDPEPIAKDGTFRIEGAALSRHYVVVTDLPDGVYVKSARFNGEDVTHAPIDLSAGGGDTLEIVLSPKAASIIGIVRDAQGQALGGVPVTLWSATEDAGSPSRGIRTALSDQNGAFQFRSLLPGDYFLAGWEEVDPGLLEYHPFLTLFNGDAATLKLAENAHAALEAPLMPPEKIKAAESQLH